MLSEAQQMCMCTGKGEEKSKYKKTLGNLKKTEQKCLKNFKKYIACINWVFNFSIQKKSNENKKVTHQIFF